MILTKDAHHYIVCHDWCIKNIFVYVMYPLEDEWRIKKRMQHFHHMHLVFFSTFYIRWFFSWLHWLEYFQEWFDYKLTWHPDEYAGVSRLYVPSNEIWLPDIALYNRYRKPFYVSLVSSEEKGLFSIFHSYSRVDCQSGGFLFLYSTVFSF